MIAKQVKGKSFRGCISYVLSKEGAEMIYSNMLGETVDELSREFGQSRKLKPNLQKCVYHASLSLPKGETLTKNQWGEVSQKYMKEMGFDGSQFVAVMHKDTEHQHIHIVASRIRLDGTVVSDSNDYKRSEKIIRGFEKEYGLQRVKPSRAVEFAALSQGELRKVLNEQSPSIKMRLQRIITDATNEKQSMTAFINKLESQGVGVIANISEKTGYISGISFVLNGELMKGSDLGKGFTWGKLKSKGIKYDINKESEFIIGHSRRIREASLQQSRHKNERSHAIKFGKFESKGQRGYGKDEYRLDQRSERGQSKNYTIINQVFEDDRGDRTFSDSDDERQNKHTSSRSNQKTLDFSFSNSNHRTSRPNSITEDILWNPGKLLSDKESSLLFGEESDEMGEVRGENDAKIQRGRSASDQKDRRRKDRVKNQKKQKDKSKNRGIDFDF